MRAIARTPGRIGHQTWWHQSRQDGWQAWMDLAPGLRLDLLRRNQRIGINKEEPTVMAEEPIELLSRARAGESEALGELCALYRNYLRMIVRTGLGPRLRERLDRKSTRLNSSHVRIS